MMRLNPFRIKNIYIRDECFIVEDGIERIYSYDQIECIRLIEHSVLDMYNIAACRTVSVKLAAMYEKMLKIIPDRIIHRAGLPILQMFLKSGKVVFIRQYIKLIDAPDKELYLLNYDSPIFCLVEIILKRSNTCRLITSLTPKEEQIAKFTGTSAFVIFPILMILLVLNVISWNFSVFGVMAITACSLILLVLANVKTPFERG